MAIFNFKEKFFEIEEHFKNITSEQLEKNLELCGAKKKGWESMKIEDYNNCTDNGNEHFSIYHLNEDSENAIYKLLENYVLGRKNELTPKEKEAAEDMLMSIGAYYCI